MHLDETETFDGLRRRLGGRRLSDAANAIEEARLFAYLRGAGCRDLSLAALADAINSLVEEEEISAHRCIEGVAVSHASDGWWLLVRHDEPLVAPSDPYDGCALPHTGGDTC